MLVCVVFFITLILCGVLTARENTENRMFFGGESSRSDPAERMNSGLIFSSPYSIIMNRN